LGHVGRFIKSIQSPNVDGGHEFDVAGTLPKKSSQPQNDRMFALLSVRLFSHT